MFDLSHRDIVFILILTLSAAEKQSPETERWKGKHCQFHVMEGLRHSKTKPINYSKLTTIHQGVDENTSTF